MDNTVTVTAPPAVHAMPQDLQFNNTIQLPVTCRGIQMRLFCERTIAMQCREEAKSMHPMAAQTKAALHLRSADTSLRSMAAAQSENGQSNQTNPDLIIYILLYFKFLMILVATSPCISCLLNKFAFAHQFVVSTCQLKFT